jgi:phage repressor protein C with HTH and peptisase S24 domain
LAAIANAANVTVDYILCRTNDRVGHTADPTPQSTDPLAAPEFVDLPRLKAVASAGNGALGIHEQLEASPFRLAGDWLRKSFGAVNSLRVVLVTGASQEPDLCDGDWVLIDEARNTVEDGLAVIRLDDGLLIKRLQRDDHTLHLLSKNPDYVTTTLDLRKDEERLKVIGKVVYSFKAV